MRTREEWRGLLAQFRDSGKGMKAFAEASGLNWRTLQHWKYILGKETVRRAALGARANSRPRSMVRAPAVPSTSAPKGFSFVELRAAAGVADGRFEIDLGADRRLRVPSTFDAEALQRLLAVLEPRS